MSDFLIILLPGENMLASMFLDSQTNSSKSVFFSSATTEYGINRTPRYNGLSHR